MNVSYLPRSTAEREQCSRTIYVSNLDKSVDLEQLRAWFQKFAGEQWWPRDLTPQAPPLPACSAVALSPLQEPQQTSGWLIPGPVSALRMKSDVQHVRTKIAFVELQNAADAAKILVEGSGSLLGALHCCFLSFSPLLAWVVVQTVPARSLTSNPPSEVPHVKADIVALLLGQLQPPDPLTAAAEGLLAVRLAPSKTPVREEPTSRAQYGRR